MLELYREKKVGWRVGAASHLAGNVEEWLETYDVSPIVLTLYLRKIELLCMLVNLGQPVWWGGDRFCGVCIRRLYLYQLDQRLHDEMGLEGRRSEIKGVAGIALQELFGMVGEVYIICP